jgi:predicted phosphoribosyltransferase
VAAAESLDLVRSEADAVVCPYALSPFYAVGVWFESFEQVTDEDVALLLGRSNEGVGRAPAPVNP